MTDREIMQQALHALEDSMYPQKRQFDAIVGLKQALAQPEPVALNKNMTLGCPAYLHGLAQPEQESPHSATHSADSAEGFGKRKWVGLTDDELAESLDLNLGEYDLCLEIEAKLKEKNT